MIMRIEDPKVFVGMKLEEAIAKILDHGYEHVVTHRDGYQRTVPQSGYDPLRIRLQIKKEIVTDASIG